MKCVKCGTDVSAEHRICYKCGEPLDRGRREESRVIIPGCNAYCSMCGTQLLENALFCHKCGANLKGHHTGPVDRYGKPTTTEVVIEKKPVWMGDGPDPNNRDNLKKTAEQRRLEELEAKRREDERRKRELEERERQLEEERRRRMLPRKDGFMQLFSILFVAGFCLLITGFCGRIMIGRLADEIVESGFFKGLEQDFGSLTTDENSKYIAKEFTVCFLRNDPSRFIKKTTRAAGNGMSFFTDLAEITVGELFNQAQAAFSASSAHAFVSSLPMPSRL